jgi:hypothetical protein
VQRRGRTPIIRYVRQLLGREDTQAFVGLARQLGAEPYSETLEDRTLVARAFRVKEPAPVNALAWFSTFVDPVPVVATLRQADDHTLALARTEFVQLFGVLRQVAEYIPGLGPVLALEMRRRPTWPPMMLYLFWLRHRESPEARQMLEQLNALLPTLQPVTPQ